MSAAEVIEQIKNLPKPEQEKIVAFVRSGDLEEKAADEGLRFLDSAAFARAKVAVFQKHDEVLRRLAQ